MKKIILSFILILNFMYSNELNFKKVLYINSYHEGFFWSDEIEKEIKKNLLNSNLQIELKVFRMNSKINSSKEQIEEKALKVKNLIEEYNPDIVITSDDNAVKYVIVPYFNNSKIKFIFCGVNASAKAYSLSPNNVTGMLEVQLVEQLISAVSSSKNTKKIAYLRPDSYSSRKEVAFFETLLNKKLNKGFIKSLKQWKEKFLEFQESSDLLLLGNTLSLKEFKDNKEDIISFVNKNIKIPTLSWDENNKDIALLIFSTNPVEQGEWVSEKAIEVLKGKSIKDIKVVRNHKANIYINTRLSKKLGIIFSFDLIDNSTLVQ